MKKLFLPILLFGLMGFAQESPAAIEKEKVKGHLSVSMLRELKGSLQANYDKNLDSLKIISIYYYQPKANCAGADAYKFIKPDKEEPKDKKYLESDLLYLCYEKNVESRYVKNDVGASVYNAFFSENRACEGAVVVTSDGNFVLVKHRASVSSLNNFIAELQRKP